MFWRFGAYICANTLPVQDHTMDVSCVITYRLSAGACREQLPSAGGYANSAAARGVMELHRCIPLATADLCAAQAA